MPPLAELNALDHPAFVAAIGHIFEHSPWIAEETWPHRPFNDAAHLHAELCATLRQAPRERQLALINAHPDLAGRLARENKLTRESTHEQASAGLNALTDDELSGFQTMNANYRQRFGFPFVICARLNAKEKILAAMRARIGNSVETEVQTALAEIEKIALLRLTDVLG